MELLLINAVALVATTALLIGAAMWAKRDAFRPLRADLPDPAPRETFRHRLARLRRARAVCPDASAKSLS